MRDMNYTDKQLKTALAKMLPETLQLVSYGTKNNKILCWKFDNHQEPVRNTELMHLCWLVEETLDPKHNVKYYNQIELDAHASWQQRVESLAKVKGIEI